MVRRKITSVNRYANMADLEREVRNRGFHMIQHGDQVIIFCDTASVSIIC